MGTAYFQLTQKLRFEQGMVTRSSKISRTVLMGLSYGLGKLGPYPATQLGGRRHLLGPGTGAENVVAYSNDLALKLETAVAEEMHECQERVGLETMDQEEKKDRQG